LTIYKTLLNQGYFPKELPPAFFTEQFAKYATSNQGRAVLETYQPSDNFTDALHIGSRYPVCTGDTYEFRTPPPSLSLRD
jgi:hypothetical protein